MSEYDNINKVNPNVRVQLPVGGKVPVQSTVRSKVQKTKNAKSQSPKTPRQEVDNKNQKDHILFVSLPQLKSPHLNQAILVDILKKLETDVFNNQLSGSKAVIKANQERIKSLLKADLKAIVKMLAKVKKQKSAGLATKIFGWIGAALGVLVGGILAVVTFGTGSIVAGLLITASIALAVTVTVLTATGEMSKLTKAMAKPIAQMLENSGMSKTKAKQMAQIIAQVIVAVVIIAVQIALAVGTGFANTGELINETIQKVASIAVKVSSFVLAANAIAGSASGVAKGVFKYQMLQDEARVTENKAFMKKMHILIKSEESTIKEIINTLLGTQKNMGAMIQNENQSRDMLSNFGTEPAAV